MKFWASLVTASFLFVWIGYFKEYKDKDYVLFAGKSYSKKQYYKAMFGTLLFALVSLFMIAPDMIFQELKLSHIRNLSLSGINKIIVEYSDGRKLIADKENGNLKDFVEIVKKAKLFYPNHEGSVNSFSLTMVLSNGEIIYYKTRIPEWHTEDISLDFNEYVFRNEIIIPNGRDWIEKLTINNKPG
jgi:hypothetical protein